MCGVGGIFSLSGKPLVNARARVDEMVKILHHRGPDKSGSYVSADGLLALGNTRLAIVDPHTDFDVPFLTADGGAVLSFNGEIYNYQQVRRDLVAKGMNFRTHSDTEVLAEGLRRFGDGFLDELDGFWSFAYFDFAARRLLLSRDIMGERHLFFCQDDNELVFASEMPPVLAASSQRHEVDPLALVSSFEFRAPPPGRSLIQGIDRMLPGRNLVVEVGGEITVRRHRRLRPEKWFEFFAQDPTENQVLDVYQDAVHEACRTRVPMEVPFFSTLSGGIDSNLVVAFSSDLGKNRIRTIHGQSAPTPPSRSDRDLNEVEAAEFSSRKFGTDHLFFRMFDEDIAGGLTQMAKKSCDGLFDEGCFSFELLARQVRANNGKVMIISDGPDELIGGYRTDIRQFKFWQMAQQSPAKFKTLRWLNSHSLGRRVITRLNGKEWWMSGNFGAKGFHIEPIHQAFSDHYLEQFFPKDLVAQTIRYFGTLDGDSAYDDILPHMDFGQQTALTYADKSLPDMFNMRTDRGIMAPSVECRLPLQAPALVELMIATPTKYRFGLGTDTRYDGLDIGTNKYILRKLVERHIGTEISSRNKYGFSFPLFRHPHIARELRMEEVVSDSSIFEKLPFNPGAKEFFVHPNQKDKLLWFAYSLTKSCENL